MRKFTQKVVSLLSVLAVCSGAVGNALLAFPAPDKTYTVKAETTNPNSSILTYDENDFTVTEDESAYVTPAIPTEDKSQILLLDGNTTDEYSQHIQLDEGKSGLLVQSKKAGDAADGTSFTFANKLKGDFEIDFRVFSQHTYQGNTSYGWGSDETGYKVTSSLYGNSFLDLRSVSFTLTSATDPTQSFTILVTGEVPWNGVTSTKVFAAVDGEAYNRNGTGNGFALTKTGDKAANVWSPGLKGTSFCNANRYELDTASNYLKVDMDSMQVFAREHHWAGIDGYEYQYGAQYTATDYLIRDLDDNTYADGTKINDSNLGSVSKADFANGYYVTVTFKDVTSTDISVVAKDDSGTATSTVDATPERLAKMLIYSVNGQSLRQYEDWSVTESEYTYTSGSSDRNALYGGQTAKVYTYTSQATGTQAEGNYVTLSDTQVEKFTDSNGCFNLSFGTDWVKDEQNNATHNQLTSLYGGTTSSSGGVVGRRGFGTRVVEADAYSDVRTMGVTVRSKTDPTKAFTLYVDSHGQQNDGAGRGLVARVAVEGEAYRNVDNRMGFGRGYYYSDNTRAWDYTELNGSFGGTNFLNVNTNNTSGNQGADPYVKMRFDPNKMQVQVRRLGLWHTVRALSAPSSKSDVVGSCSESMDRQAKGYSNLQASDFAGGYSVEVSLVHMNTNDNNGLQMMYALNKDGTIQSEAISQGATAQGTQKTETYERPGVIKIVEYKENDGIQQSLTQSDITVPAASANGYKVAWSYDEATVPVSEMKFNAEGPNNVGFTFKNVTLFGAKAIANKQVDVHYVCENDPAVSGTIATTDENGVAEFNATRPGTYAITYNGTTYKTLVDGEEKFYVYYDADVTDGEDDYKAYFPGYDTVVKFADLAPTGLKEGETLIGYAIEGKEGIYAPDYQYAIPDTFENGSEKSIRITPVIVDFAAASGASVRIATDGTSGLRFRAYMSKAAYEALNGEATFSVAMAMEGGEYGAAKVIDAANVYAENRDGADIYSMTAALYNVEKVGTGYTQNFQAKFMLSVTYVGDGEATTFTVETALKNVKDVATGLKASEEYETLTDEQKAIVDAFAGV